MPAVHGPVTGAPEEGGGLLRSAELRLVMAVMVAAGALLLALLAVAGERTDLLLLDFREWRPVNDEAHFQYLQNDPPDRRPFRLTLQLEGRPGFLAVENELPADEGKRYCFRVLASPAEPYAPEGFRIVISINGAEVWSAPLKGTGRGYAISLPGIRPRQGKVKVRLEVRSPKAQPTPAVHFEYASLRECEVRRGR